MNEELTFYNQVALYDGVPLIISVLNCSNYRIGGLRYAMGLYMYEFCQWRIWIYEYGRD